jgi:hypothetical protein
MRAEATSRTIRMIVSDIHEVDGHQVTHFRGRPIAEVFAGDFLLQVNLVNE